VKNMSNDDYLSQTLLSKRAAILAEIANLHDFRPGSLVEHYTKCGKPGCRCGQPGAPGHGPVWSLTRKEGGKTISWRVPPEALPLIQSQVAEYKRFRSLEAALIDISEQLADSKVETEVNAITKMAKKGAQMRQFRKNSSSK
jgi:hypothetical protein